MKNLKIYFTSDMHGFVYPTDYTDKTFKNIGMLNVINSFKKDPNTLIIDCGDTIQGSPFTTYLSKSKFESHPIGEVLNSGSYDYITLGNHDFNYGFDYLKKYLNTFKGSCLLANIKDKTGTLPIKPYDIKVLPNGLKIGLIGLTTEYINVWENPKNIESFEISDPFESAKKYSNLLKDKVDILIGFYHGGFEKDIETKKTLSTTKENVAYRISEELDFDILLTGHQHLPIEGSLINDTYVVQTPQHGKKFIELNLKLENGVKEIESSLKEPVSSPKKDIFDKLLPLENKIQSWLDEPVGFLDIPLNKASHLDMALKGSYLANFINQVQLEVSKADVSCTSFANSIKGFNKDVTVRDIVSTYVYPNTLVVYEIDGLTLKKGLLRSSNYLTKDNDKVVISDSFLKPKTEHYNYDYFSNIEYEFDLNKTGLDRISKLEFKGEALKDTDKITLVMNNYRASGAGGYDFYSGSKTIKEILIEMPEIIIEYFSKHKNVKVDKSKYYNIKL
ncbi:bifunctional metallophosphatase/5'-nucleotidase [Clostridium chrysemydis]|uniref:bifunctional metallophosphatase/5'-nucleotidase n=1 Tax=Clostridium chrysemydis TaxID=2665504 RepID=UPI003F3AD30B